MTAAARSGSEPADRPLVVLIAPDSFKGSLTSVEVARALAAGWARARPRDEVLLAPLADGGEGTLVAIEAAGGWEWRESPTTDPIGRPIPAAWLRSTDGRRAVIELAAASGLSRLRHDELDPLGASTRGTGTLLRAALDDGVRDITLGIGGSATNDGGAGILEALGAVVSLDRERVEQIDLSDLDPRLADTHLRIACDVTNPLLGERGAAATYGPQKGATPDQVAELDRRLGHHADALERASGRIERETPGAGAAGGTGFGLLAVGDRFASLALVPGIDVVMAAADFAGKLARADVVITGEGRIDEQTAFGKTALGVARRAEAAGVSCIAVGGGVTPAGIEALRPIGAVVVPVSEGPQTVDEAMAAGPDPVERCGERIARLLDLGRELAASSGA
ncbi:MAG TPA: glycerate kinase [Candidatus Limnocylindrales bacterium]|nr:glycerate kinase [Candidatus Limnocylindrales bacterium]